MPSWSSYFTESWRFAYLPVLQNVVCYCLFAGDVMHVRISVEGSYNKKQPFDVEFSESLRLETSSTV